MAKQKINQLQEMGQVYAYGTLGAELGAGAYHTLAVTDSSGVTVSVATATITVAGLYMIHAQQLWLTTGATNFFMKKNGTTVVHAWNDGEQQDVIVSALVQCAVGDTINFNQDTALGAAWAGDHSSWYIYLLKRTS